MKFMDFTLCSKYIDPATSQHIKFQTVDKFVGNLTLSSFNAMDYKSVSRRDDLISLTYMLILINEGGRHFLNILEDASYDHFDVIR